MLVEPSFSLLKLVRAFGINSLDALYVLVVVQEIQKDNYLGGNVGGPKGGERKIVPTD